MNTATRSRIRKMSPQLLVTDLERSMKFYTAILGFEVDFQYEDFYAGIVKDAYSLHLKLGEPRRAEQVDKRNSEDLDLVFSVDGIEELYTELAGRGVGVIQPLRSMPYGKEFYVTDPDGYILAFMEEA